MSTVNVTASNGPAVHADSLRTVLSESSTLQARVSPSTAARALEHIWYHHRELDEGEIKGSDLPMAILRLDTLTEQRIAQSASGVLQQSGTLIVDWFIRDRYPGKPNDSYIDLLNFIGGVHSDVRSIFGNDDNLGVNTIEMAFEISHSGLAESDVSFWMYSQRFTFGVA